MRLAQKNRLLKDKSQLDEHQKMGVFLKHSPDSGQVLGILISIAPAFTLFFQNIIHAFHTLFYRGFVKGTINIVNTYVKLLI